MKEKLNNSIEAIKNKPIIVCLGTLDDFGLNKTNAVPSEFDIKQAKNINWEGSEDELRDGKLLNAGEKTYVISEVDKSNKFSKKIDRCTVLVVAGIDEETGENISFLSHQDPVSLFAKNKKDSFVEHLNQRLQEMKGKCKPDSLTTLVVGGKYFSDTDPEKDYVYHGYIEMIKLIGTEIKQALGQDLIVENGPKNSRMSDDVYYINKDRKLYLIRPKVNHGIGSFPASDVDNQKKKWE